MRKKNLHTTRQKIAYYRPFEQLLFRTILFNPYFRFLHKPYLALSERWNHLREYRPRTARYGVATLSVILAIFFHIILNPFLHEQITLFSFILAVMFSGWYGGFGPGIFATFLSTTVGVILYIEPIDSIHILTTSELVRILFFIIIGIFISILNGMLRYTNKQLTNTFESISDAFFSLDRNLRFTHLNTHAGLYFRKHAQELIGVALPDIVPSYKKSLFEKNYTKALKTRKAIDFEAYSVFSSRWLAVSVYPNLDGLSIFFRDITERKELEQKRDEFVSIASHELKTPLTTVKAFAQILEKRFRKSKDTRDLYLVKNINTNIDKLTSLVNDLLDVSKIQAGKLQLHKKEFNIDHLIQKIVLDFQYITASHSISVERKAHKKVYGDEERIGQVLINLLTNAVKYSPKADKVIIKSRSNKDFVIVSVQDFGIGIPLDKQNRVFERFFRASDTNQGPSGFGLGLYISWDIIRRHSGKIWVESTVGNGSTFYFSMPLKYKK